jgi:phosphatidylcholine synthase
VLFGAIVATLPDVPFALTALSLVYLAYYVAISLWLTFRGDQRGAQRREQHRDQRVSPR